ncbi:MAG: hypothetical protein NWF04_01350 [Candidatus Bathyarchaeota archaeon]|nr:hypothetical protein [Candidatus Bathyarchaeota archaeon]
MSGVSLSVSELSAWLERETGSVLSSVQGQAQRHLEETVDALQNLAEASKKLSENSQKEIDKQNMKLFNRARALNKLSALFMDRIRKLKTPDPISYDTLNSFAQETTKALHVTEIDIRNWFPKISPFFIMDRRKFLPVFEKTKFTVNDLNEFLVKEYSKTKTLEQTYALVGELVELEAQFSEAEKARNDLRDERLGVEEEMQSLQQQRSELETTDVLAKLRQIDVEQQALGEKAKHATRHFQKPFLKMQALSSSGLTPGENQKLAQYIDEPFEALATEEPGCGILKEILEKLLGLLAQDKLKLKSDKHRKAKQDAERILKHDSLSALQTQCAQVAAKKQQLLTSQEMQKAKQTLAVIEEQTDKLNGRQANLEADETVKETARNDLLDRLKNHKTTIEQNIQSFLNKQVHIT